MTYRTFGFIGGLLGLIAFLAIGLLPSLVYGGFAGVILAAAVLGSPIGSGIMARALVAFGMLIGLLATGGLFVVMGSALSVAVYHLARLGAGVKAATQKLIR